jgi:hypothetical protein
MGKAFYITKGLGDALDIKSSNRKKEMKIIAAVRNKICFF